MRNNIAKVTRHDFALMRLKAQAQHRDDVQEREHFAEVQGKGAGKKRKAS